MIFEEIVRHGDYSEAVNKVKHGKGYQILIPMDIKTSEILKFIEEVTLK